MELNVTISLDNLPKSTPPPSSVLIQNVQPVIDCGRYPVKREQGDLLRVTADIFKDGHDKIAAYVKSRRTGDSGWLETEMRFIDNDLWGAEFVLPEIGRYEFTIEAFPDRFATWHDEVTKKVNAGLDVSVEVLEGRLLLIEARAQPGADADHIDLILFQLDRAAPDYPAQSKLLLSEEVVAMMLQHRSRLGAATL